MSDDQPALLNRLLAERRDAHRRYNEALSLLDRAIQAAPELPKAPAAYDETLLPTINGTWQLFPDGEDPEAGSASRLGPSWPALEPLFRKQMAFNAAVVEHLNRNVGAHRDAHLALERALPMLREGFDSLVRFESLLVQFLQTLTPLADTHYREIDDAIAQLRTVTDVAQRTATLAKRDVERARTAGATGATSAPAAPAAPVAPATYVGFEDLFRGSEAAIRARLADYVPYFAGQSNVLDVGCGRGEFLDLLRDAGITAKGLDLNPEMIEVCKARGLDAISADARSYLSGLPDESLGGVIAVQASR